MKNVFYWEEENVEHKKEKDINHSCKYLLYVLSSYFLPNIYDTHFCVRHHSSIKQIFKNEYLL